MTRFVVDAGAAIELASEGLEVSTAHELSAPTLLRSQTLSSGEHPGEGHAARDLQRRQGRSRTGPAPDALG